MKLKHWLRLGAFTLVTILVLTGLTNFLCAPGIIDCVGIYGFYKEPKNSIDVALIGPSNIHTSFYSPLAYEKEGFTSYALSVSAMRGSCYISAFEEMRSRQDPQVYVVDLWGFIYGDQSQPHYFRYWCDTIPDSANRTQTIQSLIDEEEWNDYIWRYRKYHGNWTELEKCVNTWKYKSQIDAQGYSIVKNFMTKTTIAEDNMEQNDADVSDTGFACLRELVNYLKEHGIQNVLFIRPLVPGLYGDTPHWDEAVAYLQAEGYPYLNVDAAADEMGIDRSRDFYNEGHCNIYGAEKVTTFLAQYLTEHYQIDTTHTDQVRAEWDHCASYNDYVLTQCKERTDDREDIFLFERDFIG